MLAHDARAIRLSQVAELDLSAASGLCARPEGLYVVADDETVLCSYDRRGRALRRSRLLPDELPEAHAERKRQKPDFESLCEPSSGVLLALGSGSTPARERAVRIDLLADDRAHVVSLSALYRALGARFSELNIEGAAVFGEHAWLLQRGNGASGRDALIRLDRERFTRGVLAGAVDGGCVLEIFEVALGELVGVRLSFTDLACDANGQLWFTASAEASDSTYDDGVCTGSVVGRLSPSGEVLSRFVLTPTCKIEGLAVDGDTLWLVADPDDRSQRAPLYRIERSALGQEP